MINLPIVTAPLNWVTLAVWLIAIAVIGHCIGVLPSNVLDLHPKGPQAE